jgi:glycosyltransferase involved in cell wall biosynthesis
VLMTSISEGLPMGILEAMAQARPVVATSVGGVPEVLRGCGMVAAPGDVHGLALAITTLLSDGELASRLGSNGYARVTRTFTRSACLREYRNLIHELAGSAGVAA